jgi:hypothetical protein
MLYDPKWTTKTKPTSAKDVLVAARHILENPDHWTKGCFARTAGGGEVDAEDAVAKSFCVHGAIIAAAGGFDVPFRNEALNLLRTAASPSSGFPGGWNDAPSRTHADVLAAFDRAIESAHC